MRTGGFRTSQGGTIATLAQLIKKHGGTLPSELSPENSANGSHPVVYFTSDKVLCPACANGENGSKASPDSDDPSWKLIMFALHSWGRPEQCSNCSTKIASAHGDPSTEEFRSRGLTQAGA